MIALLLKMKAKKERAIFQEQNVLKCLYHKIFDSEYISILEMRRLCNPIIEKSVGIRDVLPMIALQKAIRVEINFIIKF